MKEGKNVHINQKNSYNTVLMGKCKPSSFILHKPAGKTQTTNLLTEHGEWGEGSSQYGGLSPVQFLPIANGMTLGKSCFISGYPNFPISFNAIT